MTKDELKRKLRSAYRLKKEIESVCLELEKLRSDAEKATPAYSLAPGGGGSGQRIENAAIKIAEIDGTVQAELERLMALVDEIHQLIAVVDDPLLRAILRRRYLCHQPWEQIAAEMGYAWAQIHRLHAKALNEILQKMR